MTNGVPPRSITKVGLIRYHKTLQNNSAGKIERWGFCSEGCRHKKDSFMLANMNILTDDECLTLFRQVRTEIIHFNIYFKPSNFSLNYSRIV